MGIAQFRKVIACNVRTCVALESFKLLYHTWCAATPGVTGATQASLGVTRCDTPTHTHVSILEPGLFGFFFKKCLLFPFGKENVGCACVLRKVTTCQLLLNFLKKKKTKTAAFFSLPIHQQTFPTFLPV